MIQQAIYTDEDQSSIKVTYEDGQILSVPVADGNRHYMELQTWIADGNTIDDYVPPPVPSTADVNDHRIAGLKNLYPHWVNNKHYYIGQHVVHNDKLWIATSDNQNNEPDNVPGDWQEID